MNAAPDPAEVAGLAARMHAEVTGTAGDPPESYRLCARAALEWMRDERAREAEVKELAAVIADVRLPAGVTETCEGTALRILRAGWKRQGDGHD